MAREAFSDEPDWKKLMLRQERGLVVDRGANVPIDKPPYLVVRQSQLRTAHFDVEAHARTIARKKQGQANPTLKVRLDTEDEERQVVTGISKAELRKWNIYKWKKRIKEEDFDDGAAYRADLSVVEEDARKENQEEDLGEAKGDDVTEEEEEEEEKEEEIPTEEWVERQDEHGNIYYESLLTGVTQWEAPEQPAKKKEKKKKKKKKEETVQRQTQTQSAAAMTEKSDLQLAVEMTEMIESMTETERMEFDIPVVPRPLARILRSLVKIGAISNRRDADIRILFNKPVAVEEVSSLKYECTIHTEK